MNKQGWPVYDILGRELKVNDLAIFAKGGRGSGWLDVGLVTGFTKTRVNYTIKNSKRHYRGGYQNEYAEVWSNKQTVHKRFPIENDRGTETKWARAYTLQAYILGHNETLEALDEFERTPLPDHLFTEDKRP